MSDDSVKVMCRYCDRATIYERDTISLEVKRLESYNYEILTCHYCSHKYSIDDFKKALGTFTNKDVIESIEKSVEIKPDEMYYLDPDKQAIEAIKEAEIALKNFNDEIIKQEEIKKMQNGEEYDAKIVGPVEMEQGTPGDKRCVTFLKTEGEIYAYAYLFLKYAFKTVEVMVGALIAFIVAVANLIWDILKKINWCIVCSIARIAYFISYVGVIIYGVIATFVMHEAIFDNQYRAVPYYIWTISIILVLTIPAFLQLIWAFESTSSRWAKVIKKSAEKITKK
jgi:uncharacterized membrane protein